MDDHPPAGKSDPPGVSADQFGARPPEIVADVFYCGFPSRSSTRPAQFSDVVQNQQFIDRRLAQLRYQSGANFPCAIIQTAAAFDPSASQISVGSPL